jgi:hypothetical protein
MKRTKNYDIFLKYANSDFSESSDETAFYSSLALRLNVLEDQWFPLEPSMIGLQIFRDGLDYSSYSSSYYPTDDKESFFGLVIYPIGTQLLAGDQIPKRWFLLPKVRLLLGFRYGFVDRKSNYDYDDLSSYGFFDSWNDFWGLDLSFECIYSIGNLQFPIFLELSWTDYPGAYARPLSIGLGWTI